MKTYHASAPVRLDFAGGWTDVAPFVTEQGGAVVNAAIELRAEVTLGAGGTGFTIESHDLGKRLNLDAPAELEPNGELDLHKVALRMSGLAAGSLTTRSAAPPGSGLGSSGALGVALAAVLRALRGEPGGPAEIAEEAWQLEAVEAALSGGKQDQYAAALGGMQLLRFQGTGVAIEPIQVDDATRQALADHLVVCYTGASRLSSHTIARVMGRYVEGDLVIRSALEAMVGIAHDMAEALPAGDLARIGGLMSRNWIHQQALDPAMATPAMTALEQAARVAGTLGGKAAGSGAGGCMIFLAGDEVEAVRQAARAMGAVLLPVRWASAGVRTW